MNNAVSPSPSRSYLFFALLILASFLIAAVIPPVQSPDEPDHLKRAYLFGHGQLLLSSEQGQLSGGMVDPALLKYFSIFSAMHFKPDVKVADLDLQTATTLRWSGDRVFSAAPGTGYYLPLIYLPQAVALRASEAIDLTIDQSYTLVRLTTLAAIALVLVFAARLFPIPPLGLVLLFLPMSLFQLASPTLDGLISALSILALAIYMRAVEQRSISNRLLFALSITVFLIASSRVNLLPLTLLIGVLYIYTRRSATLAYATVTLIASVVWTLIALKTTVDTRIEATGKTGEIILYYLTGPQHFIYVLANTLVDPTYLAFYAKSFLGILGQLDTYFTGRVYLMIMGSAAVIGLLTLAPRFRIAHAALILASFAAVLLTFFALLINWNTHPAVQIAGVQGRYFLIPAMLVAYAISSPTTATRPLRVVATLVLSGYIAFSTMNTVTTLIARYYTNLPVVQAPTFDIVPSPALSRASPIKFALPLDAEGKPLHLNELAIMIGTYKRSNPGQAVLLLTDEKGENTSIPFNLAELEDNAYRPFDLGGNAYRTAEIQAIDGGGISVWMTAPADGKGSLVCLKLSEPGKLRKGTAGCP